MPTPDLDMRAWAASGPMALTGRDDGPPLGPPAPLVPGLARIGSALAERAAERGLALEFDPLRLLSDRAALSGLARHGATSCGEATRLVRAADGWLAVSLARDQDRQMIPAWLEVGGNESDPWPAVEARVRTLPAVDVVARARLLGMPVAALGNIARRADPSEGLPVRTTEVARRAPRAPREQPIVVDLSSLWAGPLCSHMLDQFGARVIKVESTDRPDGTRRGQARFYDYLNAGKESVALDFRSPEDLGVLRTLLAYADVVIEASRPRALEQLGIVAADLLAYGPTVWLSITGYGRQAPARDWVAFGDDAAVAGGLVVWDETGPCFCADAVADPLTGLVATLAALDALRHGRTVLLDVAMAVVASEFSGPTLAAPSGLEVPAPVAPPVARHAPALGEHNEAVLAELARRS